MEKSILSPAKVNLYLKVTSLREDRYHELESLFQKISLADTITFGANDSGVIRLRCSDANLPTDDSNLIVKAAKMLQTKSDCSLGADIDLIKKIPVGAGLGGGSSNAATTLMTLNDMWGIDLSQEKLEDMALQLGADVPFFLGSGDTAWVEGIGERLTPLTPQKSLEILLINPGFHISAGEAYAKSKFDFTNTSDKEKIIDDLLSGEPERVTRALHNDLEPWAFNHYPELARLKIEVERANPKPMGVLMSGSGPTLMAIYETDEICQEAESILYDLAPFVKMTEEYLGNNPRRCHPKSLIEIEKPR